MSKLQNITTNRLYLVKLQSDMHVSIHQWMIQSEVMKYTNIEKPENYADTVKWVQDKIERSDNDIEWTWLIKEKDRNRIGLISAKDIGKGTYLITFLEDSYYWSKGYMTEAVNGVIDFLFSKCDAERVMATCYPDNRASERVMQKVGMHRVWLPKTFADEETGKCVYQHCYIMEGFHP